MHSHIAATWHSCQPLVWTSICRPSMHQRFHDRAITAESPTPWLGISSLPREYPRPAVCKKYNSSLMRKRGRFRIWFVCVCVRVEPPCVLELSLLRCQVVVVVPLNNGHHSLVGYMSRMQLLMRLKMLQQLVLNHSQIYNMRLTCQRAYCMNTSSGDES